MPDNQRMYAIAFDLDTTLLKKHYNENYNNAYTEIKSFLEAEGFERQQGSVYFGTKDRVNAVSCVMSAAKLSKTFPWFAPCVKDIRMLRIEEANDLKPAVISVL